MSRMTLAGISKMPAALQQQVAAQLAKPSAASMHLPKKALPKYAATAEDGQGEGVFLGPQSLIDKLDSIKASPVAESEASDQSPGSAVKSRHTPVEMPALPIPAPSALDSTQVYIPAALLRHILENWGGAYYVCANETQRRRVVDNAIKSLAQTA